MKTLFITLALLGSVSAFASAEFECLVSAGTPDGVHETKDMNLIHVVNSGATSHFDYKVDFEHLIFSATRQMALATSRTINIHFKIEDQSTGMTYQVTGPETVHPTLEKDGMTYFMACGSVFDS